MPRSQTQQTATQPANLPSLHEFAEKTLGITVWPKIREIFDAFAPEDGTPGSRKILVRSCNGAGKTTALAAICNWYFMTYPDSIVLTTASSWNQVRWNLWGEIRRQARAAKLYDGREVTMFETKIEVTEKHFMIGISPNIPENAMGFHAPRILVAVDEATGVTREIMTALTGNLTGEHAQIVLICNPIDRDSYPFEAEQSGDWTVIHISAFDHPNVENDSEEIPGAVSRTWIVDRLKSWTTELTQNLLDATRGLYIKWLDRWYRRSPMVDARILGEWADLEHEGFIPLDLIKARVWSRKGIPRERWGDLPPVPEGAPRVRALGVDIGRGVGGDATVYASFEIYPDGPDLQRLFVSTYDENLMEAAERIRNEYEECCQQGIELVIAVDDTGLGGGVCDKLKKDGIPHFPVQFGASERGLFPGKEIANTRAEMYFLLKEELLEGTIRLLDSDRFHREIAAVRLDRHEGNHRYKMEAKNITKRRLGRSTDFADATALARYGLKLREIEKRKKFIP